MTPKQLGTHWKLIAVRELPDGSVAGIQELVTTYGLILGIEEWTTSYRFCYPNLFDALQDLAQLKGERDVPDGHWIACRPEVRVRGDDGLPRYPTPAELRELREKAQR